MSPETEAEKAEPTRWRWAEPCWGRGQAEGQDPESQKVAVTGMELTLTDSKRKVWGRTARLKRTRCRLKQRSGSVPQISLVNKIHGKLNSVTFKVI